MKIFEGFGLSLHKREDKYYIRYMAGEIASWIVEIEVTPDEATQVQFSKERADEVVFRYQNKCFAETGDFWKESDFISAKEMCREGYIVPEGTQPPTKIR